MLKLFFKVKKKLKEKGFTLVELLAVIVILAIIMLIAIPAVLNTVQSAKRRSFVTYVDKVGKVATEKWLKDAIDGKRSENGCFIYNLKTDFDLSNVGTFKGYVLVNSTGGKTTYYITLWNEDYMLIAYNYTEGVNYKGTKMSIEQSLELYDSSRSDELKPSVLCNYGCSECVYESAESDPYNSDSTSNMTGDPMKIKGITILIKGEDFNSKAFQLSGETNCSSSSNCKKIKYIKKSHSLNQELNPVIISNNDETSQKNPVYMWFDTDTLYYYTEATKIYLNSDSSYMFFQMQGLLDANEFISNIYTSNVTNMYGMFAECTNLATLDLSNFDTSKVTNMFGMFTGCTNLRTIDVSHFDTSRVTDMSHMFDGCLNLTTLDVSNFNTSNVTDMSNMFDYCAKLTTIDVSHFDTSKVTNMSCMFFACYMLTTLDVSNFNTSNVTNMSVMFESCRNLKSIDVSHFDTSKVTDMAAMFSNCLLLEEIIVKKFDVSSVTDSNHMFDKCTRLPNYNVSKIDISMAKDKNQGGYLTVVS